ncbi:MAG TPA: kelch repeat-containing protein, partial [Solirubrobacterales bacterium]|nr:kelch repeat-containing protein [Solirubrobacterales bacterium]
MLWKLRLAAGLALALGLLVPQAALGAGAGSFGPTGSMGAARYAAVAAPLKDGRVLVAGGYYDDGGGDHYLASAEVFNPATNAFTPVGDMGIARVRSAAAPLPDGRVLVAGGNDGATRLSSAEVFNPATNVFTPVADMETDRARAAAAPLPGG